ncbi:SUF system NifU family Fe-S cluster assembly protein [Candidatus Woesearchaeota archaeon]|nr:MAG: SUF system NifU family Fe-S cluster assembly protein [Candidatus Woesearchaeota archaeon]
MSEDTNPDWVGEDEIYKENILDHYKHPRNFGEIKNSFCQEESNPLCGDEVKLYVKVENGKVIDAKFVGKGCAISMAATSMLTEKIKGMAFAELEKLGKDDILEMIGVPLGVVRMKCGLLSWRALKKIIEKMGE